MILPLNKSLPAVHERQLPPINSLVKVIKTAYQPNLPPIVYKKNRWS